MRKLTMALSLAAGMSLLSIPGTAMATPTSCGGAVGSYSNPYREYAIYRCDKGSGHYRKKIWCHHDVSKAGFAYYGPWRQAGSGDYSRATCPSSLPHIVNQTNEKTG